MKLRQFAVAAAIVMSGTAAHAFAPIFNPNLGTDPDTVIGGVALSGPGLTTDFTFSLSTLSNVFGDIFSLTGPVTINSISLTGPSLATTTLVGSGYSFENIAAGNYTMSVSASSPFSGSIYVGTVKVSPVPEAETYALALAGLGVVGLVAARRRKAQ
ncbi:MAG: FxDxF family PEP-CTERM protein [Aquabacterium sp.]